MNRSIRDKLGLWSHSGALPTPLDMGGHVSPPRLSNRPPVLSGEDQTQA